MAIHIALLRGINVGGKNKIKMAELREALEASGIQRVQTYIQSGNILFESEKEEPELCKHIEQVIEASFGLSIRVIIRSAAEMEHIAANRPFTEAQVAKAAASCEGECLYVSMMLDAPKPDKLSKLEAFDAGADQWILAGRDLYLLFAESVRGSKLAVQADKLSQPTTVRNWNTVNKLIELAREMEG
ncbi:uncharacterized protein (DUF1697 family) [Paenibacillus taihuensis]|uniref:Uncharacterized protein (DUF1697 family) n=1 Tax=Paenibacillus taihuensis TaxID=1156355 RepID=A0A3D9QUJ0_9BACL|nr:DUF1697 domain-containing protein [Paenibacillus taihuensis]REE67659.1 uncharacterized protein (DUF1697 family) [Paenibacillus taihuensis]